MVMLSSALVTVPSSSVQVNLNVPLSSTLAKNYVRVRGDRRPQVRRKNRLAIKFADEFIDDLAWNWLAIFIFALAGLHHVRQQRFDFDDFALFCFLGKL